MLNTELRKIAIIKKYGSWEKYEEQRKKKTRETALARCKTLEEREKKLKKLKKEDLWKASIVEENIGKEIICTKCGGTFIAGTNQHLFCKKCILAEARIAHSGSLEEYYKYSKVKENETRAILYGDPYFNNRALAKQTCLEHFGVDHPAKHPQILKKIQDTKLERYGDARYNNIEQTKQTNIHKYGVTSTLLLPEVIEKGNKTKIDKYDDINYSNRELFKKTCNERYGGNAPSCSPLVREKTIATNIQKFGYPAPAQNKEIYEKIKNTTLERYGVDNYGKTDEARVKLSKRVRLNPPMDNPDYVKKMMTTTLEKYGAFTRRTLYKYNDLLFDSSWELYYYIYLIENKKTFQYKPEPLTFLIGEVLHFYHPDFYVNNQYVEIKGDHFINEEGVLLSFQRVPQYEKTQALKEYNVLILKKKEIQPIMDWVDNKFGKSFIKKYRVKK